MPQTFLHCLLSFFVLTSYAAPARMHINRISVRQQFRFDKWELRSYHSWCKSYLATMHLPLHSIAATFETCNCSKLQKREHDKPRELPLKYQFLMHRTLSRRMMFALPGMAALTGRRSRWMMSALPGRLSRWMMSALPDMAALPGHCDVWRRIYAARK